MRKSISMIHMYSLRTVSSRVKRTRARINRSSTPSRPWIERFERYPGRRFRWQGKDKLRLVPHAFEGRNAFFDPERKAVLFGYYRADTVDPGANLPNQMIFTCLSSDIIAHEVTHAIVHRLRPYSEATHKDVFAWHEAFADLIALFQHFAYPDVVLNAVASTSGSIQQGGALFDLASEFGQSTGRGEALRRAINPPFRPKCCARLSVPRGRRTPRAGRVLRRRGLRRLPGPLSGRHC